ncbi:winged helix-turn-helix transcriptional regulator [Stakelama sp. CBK3Z-3]|uniref:Winged helix-turn-helix transcriptional regulator n=1 Tax=Stakelama flava TaxID=2860338 RepID=A0ABS6XJF6_9SPHN|nr:winged helix-turn-helix transcriptional regulator [Stakelama flava]MBW4330034.1 winged helix-turn-helix transcriptional regulator [Stakelama flava]
MAAKPRDVDRFDIRRRNTCLCGRPLRELEEEGPVVRKVYAQVPPKVEYSGSPLERSLAPSLAALINRTFPGPGDRSSD